jgi:MFS_1 like family
MFWISGAISKRIGVNGVLTWSFTSYVLRFIIYASIKNPWQVGGGAGVSFLLQFTLL